MVETTLRCLLTSQPGPWGWEELLPEVKYALNTSVNASMNETPFKLLYGVDLCKEVSMEEVNYKNAKDFLN